MGRIFRTQISTDSIPAGKGGRIFGKQDNPNTEPFNPNKSWDELSFGQKIWGVTQELPKVLYNFIPESARELIEKKTEPTLKEKLLVGPKGALEFFGGIANVTVQAVGGAILGGIEKITGKPQSVEIPGIKSIAETLGLKGISSEIFSYQQQSQDLQKQGYTQNEARALVGINAYLGLLPVGGRVAITKTGIKTI